MTYQQEQKSKIEGNDRKRTIFKFGFFCYICIALEMCTVNGLHYNKCVRYEFELVSIWKKIIIRKEITGIKCYTQDDTNTRENPRVRIGA